MRILILGGYGTFGGRLAQLLADRADLTLFIAGRDKVRADDFCLRFPGPARAIPLRLDRRDIADHLATCAIDVVVDASGPFQGYGADPYFVPRACIAAGCQYLDFSDAADFTAGISTLQDAAAAKGVVILSGVSSFPVLTAAVLRVLAQDMTITHVVGGIAPSPHAIMGLNVMRAVVGYAGEDLRLWRGGAWANGKGLAETERFTVAPPGMLPLGSLKFALVDVPDLQVIPPHYPTLQSLWMGAGPSPGIMLSMLVALAQLRAKLPIPSLVSLAPLFQFVLRSVALITRGEHRGGMFVQATGTRDGAQVKKSWHLLAEGDDGPFIPSMATEIILRRMADGVMPEPGARPATNALELSDYETAILHRNIHFGWRGDKDVTGRLYPDILGAAFGDLPQVVQNLHSPEWVTGTTTWKGEAKIDGARNVFGALLARLFSFPSAASSVPVTVTFRHEPDQETWTRQFGEHKMQTVQTRGTGRNAHLMVEQFGPVRIALAVTVVDGELHLTPRSWSVFHIPLPRFLLPTGDSFESEKDGKFCFDVSIIVPIFGRLVRYRGRLSPV